MSDIRFIEVPTLDVFGFRSVLMELVRIGGSDVFIKSDQRISVKKHGKKHYITKRPIRNDEVVNLINLVQKTGDASRVTSGTPIDFSYSVQDRSTAENLENMLFRIHCGSFSGNKGLSMTIRLVNSKPPTPEEIDLDQSIVDAHLIGGNGVSFICGNTGSGKSTTQAALNSCVLTMTDCHLITYEDPIETYYDSLKEKRTDCTQYLVGHDVKTYKAGVVCALRQNPDFIMLGETRDHETMDAVLTAAETGHAVSTTLHVPRGFLLFSRAVSMFPTESQHYAKTRLADMLNYIVYQTLVPTVKGGLMAVREMLVIDSTIRRNLIDCKLNDVTQVMYEAFESKGTLIDREAKRVFEEKLINEDEFEKLMKKYSNQFAVNQKVAA